MKVLVACEESQEVTIAFRDKGHEAFSCDIIPCSGGHPEWHIQDDVRNHINKEWDLMIAFPPCTFLSFAGNGYFAIDKFGRQALNRWKNRIDAMEFFYELYLARIEKICIENPMGFPVSAFKKPDQKIEPYYFGDSDKKATFLWLKNLPKLEYSLEDNLFSARSGVKKPSPIYIDKISGKKRYRTDAISGTIKNAQIIRSKTFPGIARAMAEQWG